MVSGRRLLNHLKRSIPLSKPYKAKSPTSDTPKTSISSEAQAQAQAQDDNLAKEAKEAKEGISEKKRGKQPCRAFLCFDVEATCRGGKEFNWPNEIIVSYLVSVHVMIGRKKKLILQEFPVVLLRWSEDVHPPSNMEGDNEDVHSPANMEGDNEAGPSTSESRKGREGRLIIVDTFHTYVKPVWSPQLSDFCVKFTGITQVSWSLPDDSYSRMKYVKLIESRRWLMLLLLSLKY